MASRGGAVGGDAPTVRVFVCTSGKDGIAEETFLTALPTTKLIGELVDVIVTEMSGTGLQKGRFRLLECFGESPPFSAGTLLSGTRAIASLPGDHKRVFIERIGPVLAGGGEGGAAAAAGGRAADAFQRLPDGRMPPEFRVILNSAVVGIYDGKTPVSTAVFFSPTRALTAFHDGKPEVGAVRYGASAPNKKPVREWKFQVVASSPKDDLVVLEIISGPEPTHFLPITADPDIASIGDSEAWLVTFGISAAKMGAEAPNDIAVGSFRHKVEIAAYGSRHFVYHSNTGRGDSGGALISLGGNLFGLHLGGWNDASPPPSPETVAASSAARGGGKKPAKAYGGAGAAIIKNKNRIVQMGLADVGTATRESVVKLSQQLTAGGYAIYLGSPDVSALCSGAAEGAGGGSAAVGKKHKPAGGGAGAAAAGGGRGAAAAGGGGGAATTRGGKGAAAIRGGKGSAAKPTFKRLRCAVDVDDSSSSEDGQLSDS